MMFTNNSQNDPEEIPQQRKGNPMGNGAKKKSECLLTYKLSESEHICSAYLCLLTQADVKRTANVEPYSILTET